MAVDSQNLQIETDRVITLMQKQLEQMSYEEIDKEATKKKLVDEELKRVQRATQSAARAALGDDPRQAYKGVRAVKYKKIFGGNVNILTSSKGGTYVSTVDRMRVRNRYRSQRTKKMESYAGPSRAFVLRFIEKGTVQRTAGTKYSSRGGSGNRGAITAKNFMSTAQNQMAAAPDRLWKQIETILNKQFEK